MIPTALFFAHTSSQAFQIQLLKSVHTLAHQHYPTSQLFLDILLSYCFPLTSNSPTKSLLFLKLSPVGLLLRLLNTFCCFCRPLQNQFHFHPYCMLVFSALFNKTTCLQLIASFHRKLRQSSFLNNSLSALRALKTIDPYPNKPTEVFQTKNHFIKVL